MFARLEPIFLANRWTAKQAAAVPTRPPSVDTATATEPASMADLKEAVSPRSRRRRSHSATLEIPNAEPSDAEADREDEGDDDDDDDGEDGINNSEPEDQFHFSEGNTPSNERAAPILSLGTSYLRRRDSALLGKKVAEAISEPLTSSTGIARSKPIDIEIPHRKFSLDPDSFPAITPPEPLSARGDIPGGYFPFHEDPDSRVRRPHPFHADASRARRRSIHRAAKSMQSTTGPAASIMPELPKPAPMSTSSSGAPATIHVSSYIPMGGVPEPVVLPLGKYYPTNWEKRQSDCDITYRIRSMSLAAKRKSVAAKPEPQSPQQPQTEASHSGHVRSKSETKRRLIQYKRDMITQATVATSTAIKQAAASSTSSAAVRSRIQLSESIIKANKPTSPRLTPVGSPGPVTPMSLESGGDGYLTKGLKSAGKKPAQRRASSSAKDKQPAPISI